MISHMDSISRHGDSQASEDDEVEIIGEFQGPRRTPEIVLPDNMPVFYQVVWILAQVSLGLE